MIIDNEKLRIQFSPSIRPTKTAAFLEVDKCRYEFEKRTGRLTGLGLYHYYFEVVD